MLKGQVATEFFLYASVFLIIVIGVASTLQFTQSAEITTLEYNLARETGEKFADSLNLVIKGGDGFKHTMLFSKTILSRDYSITFSDNFLVMEWDGTSGSSSTLYPIITSQYVYTGCIKNKQLKSSAGDNKLIITNSKGVITVNQEGCQ
ncbi:hypothetical protein HYT84_02085 [Candidatus Micrarchaeota archaeon]|nr:hypothetical protein [Candidatus Micrarchaeota archaeon]